MKKQYGEWISNELNDDGTHDVYRSGAAIMYDPFTYKVTLEDGEDMTDDCNLTAGWAKSKEEIF